MAESSQVSSSTAGGRPQADTALELGAPGRTRHRGAEAGILGRK